MGMTTTQQAFLAMAARRKSLLLKIDPSIAPQAYKTARELADLDLVTLVQDRQAGCFWLSVTDAGRIANRK